MRSLEKHHIGLVNNVGSTIIWWEYLIAEGEKVEAPKIPRDKFPAIVFPPPPPVPKRGSGAVTPGTFFKSSCITVGLL